MTPHHADVVREHRTHPRYLVQMGKQTMGTPFHNWRSQTTNKVYRLQYPQEAIVRNKHYDDINMEEFCLGFNAVVAIMSYTVQALVNQWVCFTLWDINHVLSN